MIVEFSMSKKTQTAGSDFGCTPAPDQYTSEKSAREIQTLTLSQRQAFLKLPLEERRSILAQQAEAMVAYYEQNPEWRELVGGDIFEY